MTPLTTPDEIKAIITTRMSEMNEIIHSDSTRSERKRARIAYKMLRVIMLDIARAEYDAFFDRYRLSPLPLREPTKD